MKRGFTLIEVVVVLFVLAVAMAVGVPAIGRGADGLRVRAEAAGLANFLRAAREQAVTRNRAYEVRVDPEAGAIVMVSVGGTAGARSGATVLATRRLAARVRIEADPPLRRTVTFTPQGLSSGGRFRVGLPGPRVYVVTVDPITGRVVTRQAEL
jgi:prepilin-type N-terminal cleavage/methylation domain-containing protein